MVNIGIEVDFDQAERKHQNGRVSRTSPYRLRCAALGLETQTDSLAVGLYEMRRLRVEELERRLREKPDDWELTALLNEAREDESEDADTVAVMLAIEGAQYQDEIAAKPEPHLTFKDKIELAKDWRAVRRRTVATARKKADGRKKEKSAV